MVFGCVVGVVVLVDVDTNLLVRVQWKFGFEDDRTNVQEPECRSAIRLTEGMSKDRKLRDIEHGNGDTSACHSPANG